MQKKKKYPLLLIILMLPLLYINVKDSHDWGDDFAQYLIQARNIVEFRDQTENGLVVEKSDSEYAVAAYPVGFPLLISPLYFISGTAIAPYLALLAIMLIAIGIICFEYFRGSIGVFGAFLIALLFCYNPYTLELKKQILAEIPFTCAFMFLLLWLESAESQKKFGWIVTAIILALVVSLRLAGFAFMIGFVFFELWMIFKNRKSFFSEILRLSITLFSGITLFVLLNEVIFPVRFVDVMGFYGRIFTDYQYQFLNHLTFYYKASGHIFPFFGWQIPSFWLILSLAGWFIHLIKKNTPADFLFPVYLLVVLSYPYTDAGVRFLIPVLPLLIFYLSYFISNAFYSSKSVGKPIVNAIYFSMLLAYLPSVYNSLKTTKSIEDGPQNPLVIEMFDFIKSYPEKPVIAFCRARAMYLYTGNPTIYFNHNEKPEVVKNSLDNYDNLLIVIPERTKGNTLTDTLLENAVKMNMNRFRIIWTNGAYTIYTSRKT